MTTERWLPSEAAFPADGPRVLGSNGLMEPNGSAAATDSTPSGAESTSVPAYPPGRRRRLQKTFAALLALTCTVAAVVSIRVFVAASTNRFPGAIEPAQTVSLDFSEMGYLSSLRVYPGDYIRRGEILARLNVVGANAVDMAAQAASAAVVADQQDVAVAQQQVTTTPAVKLAAVRRAQAQLASDEARLAQARAVLDQATIRSPVDGMVMQVNGAVGDLVGADGVQIASTGQPSQLAQTSDLSLSPQSSLHSAGPNRDNTGPLIELATGGTEMSAQVPESGVKELRPGRHATVTVPALGASFGARLLRVVPNPIQANGDVSYEALFVLLRPSSEVLPGMSADVTLGR